MSIDLLSPSFLLFLSFLTMGVVGLGQDGTQKLHLSSQSESFVSGCYQHTDKSIETSLCFEISPGYLHLTRQDGGTLYKHTRLPQGYHVQILHQTFFRPETSVDFQESNHIPLVHAEFSKPQRRQQQSQQQQNGLRLPPPWKEKVSTETHHQINTAPETLVILQLLAANETRILAHASEALGVSIASAQANELTREFHLLSLGLSRALLSFQANSTRNSSAFIFKQEISEYVYNRHANCKDMRRATTTKCFGMCGQQCWCWWWVCGDCCLHSACVQHDACCRRSYMSYYCFMPFLFTFKCDSGYGGYPACLQN